MPVFDLHMHSIASDDGEYTVEQLLKACERAGIDHISITDHNTVKSVPEALILGPKCGIKVISGVELDTQFRGKNFHVLGYCIDYSDQRYAQIERDIAHQEVKAAQRKLDIFEQISGLRVTLDQIHAISGDECVTGELVAEVVLNRPDAVEHNILKPYLRGGSRSDNPYVNFYWDFFSQGKAAYVPIEYISLPEAVRLIHDSGGVAVLAHPKQNLGHDADMLRAIIAEDMDGIEVYSSYHDDDDIEFFKKYIGDMLLTCGSDFHGKTKPSIKLKPILKDGDPQIAGMEILFCKY